MDNSLNGAYKRAELSDHSAPAAPTRMGLQPETDTLPVNIPISLAFSIIVIVIYRTIRNHNIFPDPSDEGLFEYLFKLLAIGVPSFISIYILILLIENFPD